MSVGYRDTKPTELFLFIICFSVNIYFSYGHHEKQQFII